MSVEKVADDRSDLGLVISLRIGFFLIGLLTVLLGQALPVLSTSLSLDDKAAGYLLSGQFIGSLAGSFVYGRVFRHFGYSRALFVAFGLMALGAAGLNLSPWLLCLTAVVIYGLGIGLAVPAINMIVVGLSRDGSASGLSTVNFFWGLGAIASKPYIDHLGSQNSIFVPTLLLSLFLFLNAVYFLFSFSRSDLAPGKQEPPSKGKFRVWALPAAILIMAFNFLQTGIESSIGGWITTYQERLFPALSRELISAALFYFLMLVLGRGIAPPLLRRVNGNVVLFGSLFLMLAGIFLVLIAHDTGSLLVGAAMLGFGCSAVFPLNMARFATLLGSRAAQNATPIFVLGALGGACLPWLVGFTSSRFDSLQTGLMVILVSCIILLGLQIVLAMSGNIQRPIDGNNEPLDT